jgi:hypothetical protein
VSDDTFAKILIIVVIVLGSLIFFGRYQVIPVTGTAERYAYAVKINRITGTITVVVGSSEISVDDKTK